MKQSSDKNKKLSIGLGLGTIGIAGYLAMLYGFSKMLLSEDSLFYSYMHKHQPDTELRQFKTRESKKIREMGFQDVSCKSFDGLTLNGHYLHNPNAKMIILFCHGWHGTWDRDGAAGGICELAKFASLLIIDMRGQGSSDGNMSMGLNEKEDIHAWLDYLKNINTEKLPVILWGVSMGGATVLMTAGDALPWEVKGIAADSGYTSAYEMTQRFGKSKFHMQNALIMRRLNQICMRLYHVDLRRCNTLGAMHRCNRPVLFIHGMADELVPYYMTIQNYNACVSDKTLFLAENAPHIGSYFTNPEGWKKAVYHFLKEKCGISF